MRKLDLADLVELLRSSAGEDESIDLDGDIQHTPFPDLGYDSLAVLELAAAIQRQYSVELSDDVVAAETPREFLDLANGELQALAA